MKGYIVYNAIQQLKERGFKRAAVAKQLNIDRRTVSRYWDMTADEYEKYLERKRRESLLEPYKQTVLLWLRTYSTATSAQICDWLK